MQPLVCVILLNYNTYEDTVECVQSLLRLEYDNYRIILVDNASYDAERISKDKFLAEHCDVILSKNNDGFAAGNNIGIKYAKEKYEPAYFWILNNDTVVDRNSLDIMVRRAEDEPLAGLVTGKINFYSDRNRTDYRGGYYDFVSARTGYFSVEDAPRTEVTFASGCNWILPCRIIDKIGYIDERYFMYDEDTDYCIRILEAGLKILYCDTSVIFHKISASNGANSRFNQYYMTRNELYIIKKYAPNKFQAYFVFTKLIIKDIGAKRKNMRVVIDAIRAFLKRETGRNERY